MMDPISSRGDAAARFSTDDLDPAQWDRLRQWVEAETGMDFAGARVVRLRDAVQRAFDRAGTHFHIDALLAAPERHGPFFERLNAELTVGESYFFRNEHHFQALRDRVMPAILKDNAASRSIRVWSAGCATGEEPYSVAILLDQEMAGREGWSVSILGTDLNPEFLEGAREASYRPWSFRQTEIHRDRRYFRQEADSFRLVPAIRERVRFVFLNLVKDAYPSSLTGTLGLDLILFRNVAIYLKPDVTRAILKRFQRALRPGGWLLLGETEISLARIEGFASHVIGQATLLQKAYDAESYVEDILPPIVGVSPAPAGRPTSIPLPQTLPVWSPLPTLSPGSSAQPASPQDEVDRCLIGARLDDAERAVARLSDRTERARLRLRCCRAFLAAAEKERARRMLRACLAEEPLLLEAHLLEASFAEEAGDLGAAEAAYRRALYLDRNCAMAHFHLALVQQRKGDQANATRGLRTTVQLSEGKPADAAVEFGEGMCYGRLVEMALLLLDQ